MSTKIKISNFLSEKKLNKIEKICMDGSDVEYNYDRIENILSEDFKVKDLGTNRIIFINSDKKYSKYIFKIAGDEHGIDANYREFRNGDLSKWLTKSYSISDNGVVLVQERVQPFNSDMMKEYKHDVRSMLKKLSKKILLVDCKISNFKNFGLRKDKTVCLLDHGDTVPLPEYQNFGNSVNAIEEMNISFKCKKILSKRAGKKGGKLCGGKLKYNKNYEYFICDKCGNYSSISSAYTDMLGYDDKEVNNFDMKEFKKKLREVEQQYAKTEMLKTTKGDEEDMCNKNCSIVNGYVIPNKISMHPLYKTYVQSFKKGDISISKLSKLCNCKFKEDTSKEDAIDIMNKALSEHNDRNVKTDIGENDMETKYTTVESPTNEVITDGAINVNVNISEPDFDDSHESDKSIIELNEKYNGYLDFSNKLHDEFNIESNANDDRDIREELKFFAEYIYKFVARKMQYFYLGASVTDREGIFLAKQFKNCGIVHHAFYVRDDKMLVVVLNNKISDDTIESSVKEDSGHAEGECNKATGSTSYSKGSDAEAQPKYLNMEEDDILDNENAVDEIESVDENIVQIENDEREMEFNESNDDIDIDTLDNENLDISYTMNSFIEKIHDKGIPTIRSYSVGYEYMLTEDDIHSDDTIQYDGDIQTFCNDNDAIDELSDKLKNSTISTLNNLYPVIDDIDIVSHDNGDRISVVYTRYYNKDISLPIHIMNMEQSIIRPATIRRFLNYFNSIVVYSLPEDISNLYDIREFISSMIETIFNRSNGVDFSDMINMTSDFIHTKYLNIENKTKENIGYISMNIADELYVKLISYICDLYKYNLSLRAALKCDDMSLIGCMGNVSDSDKCLLDGFAIVDALTEVPELIKFIPDDYISTDEDKKGFYDRLVTNIFTKYPVNNLNYITNKLSNSVIDFTDDTITITVPNNLNVSNISIVVKSNDNIRKFNIPNINSINL